MSSLKFNDTTDLLGIVQGIESNTLLGNGAISGNTVLLKETTRNVNKRNSTVWSWIFFSYGGWQFDDSNQTDLPYASDTLTINKRSYANAAGAAALKGVAYKDSSGYFQPLIAVTHEELNQAGYTIDSFMPTAGTPRYYMPVGTSTYIFPASDTTRSLGFKQYFDRGTVAFTSASTTQTPGFNAEFHEALVVGGTLDWYLAHKTNDRGAIQEYRLEWQDYERRIKKFYCQQYEQLYPLKPLFNANHLYHGEYL